jgi:hypothetical protein
MFALYQAPWMQPRQDMQEGGLLRRLRQMQQPAFMQSAFGMGGRPMGLDAAGPTSSQPMAQPMAQPMQQPRPPMQQPRPQMQQPRLAPPVVQPMPLGGGGLGGRPVGNDLMPQQPMLGGVSTPDMQINSVFNPLAPRKDLTRVTPEQLARTPALPPVQAAPSSMWDAAAQRLGQIDPQTWFQMAGAFLNAGEGGPVGDAFTQVGQALEGQSQRGLRREQSDWLREQRARETVENEREDTEYANQQTLLQQARRVKAQALADPNLSADDRRELEAMAPEDIAAWFGRRNETRDTRAREDALARQQRAYELEKRGTLTAAEEAEIGLRREEINLRRRALNAAGSLGGGGAKGGASGGFDLGALQNSAAIINYGEQALALLDRHGALNPQVGLAAEALARIPASEQAQLRGRLGFLATNAAFSRVMELRAAGVSMNPMTDKDFDNIKNATTLLDPGSNSVPQLRQNVVDLMETHARAMLAAEQSLTATQSGQSANRPSWQVDSSWARPTPAAAPPGPSGGAVPTPPPGFRID